MSKHLLVALSAHGFGHAGQTAPVVNRLREMCPDLRVTVRTTLPRAFLAARFSGAFEVVAERTDFGMVMRSAIDVLRDESAAAYRDGHRDWPQKVRAEAERLQTLAPDLVLANVPYLPLAGAATAGIPAVALCSLNWADIYAHYLGDRPEAQPILAEMRAAYQSAQAFLQTEPHMPMADLRNRRPVGPVARVGRSRRAEILARLGLSADTRLVNIAPGGMELKLPMAAWPALAGVHWIVPESWRIDRPDTTAFETVGMLFTDVLASSDVLIGKPGYGSFAEVACSGIPMLYVRRHDWPEEPYLVEWLAGHGRALEISREDLNRGDVAAPLDALLRMPPAPRVVPTGIEQAAQYLTGCL